MNAEQQPSTAAISEHGTATNNNADHDYITMDDLVQDMADDDGGELGSVMEAKDVELF